jgi:hypothetical protein
MRATLWPALIALGSLVGAAAGLWAIMAAVPVVGPADLQERAVAEVQPGDPLVAPQQIDADHLEAVKKYLEPLDLIGSGRAHAHPHGTRLCASGCATNNHPTRLCTKDEFHRLMEQFAHEPMDETSPALEALMYYNRQTRMYIDRYGTAPLDEQRARFLRRELEKTHAFVSVRIVDEFGVVRSWLPPTRVPLDIRHEYIMETHDIQPLETSGTVKRVGLYHIWQRI